MHPGRITREDKKLVNNFNYDGVGFPVQEKDYSKIREKNIYINVFCYENNLGFPIYISNKTFENSKNLLLVTDGDKSHYVYIKDLCFTKQRVKTKNTFAKVVHSVLVVKIC